jgi:diadenosine tetraphosphatase ApaH/serine/threonine PP2A family protein phosphatase
MRIAVISDVHANLPALEAVLPRVAADCEQLWVTGDIVGYGAEPDAVVGRLRDAGAVAVRGNHDHVAAGNPGAAWFNPIARTAIEWTADRIDHETRRWLGELPEARDADGWRLVHGSPRDPLWEYVDDESVAAGVFDEVPVTLAVFGHTHVPMAFVVDEGQIVSVPGIDGGGLEIGERRAMLNPGSVGQPRDGDPRASFMVIDTDQRRATWHRVPYDVAAAAARIRDAGLPEPLASRLTVGR